MSTMHFFHFQVWSTWTSAPRSLRSRSTCWWADASVCSRYCHCYGDRCARDVTRDWTRSTVLQKTSTATSSSRKARNSRKLCSVFSCLFGSASATTGCSRCGSQTLCSCCMSQAIGVTRLSTCLRRYRSSFVMASWVSSSFSPSSSPSAIGFRVIIPKFMNQPTHIMDGLLKQIINRWYNGLVARCFQIFQDMIW